ncbi:MAG: CotH kinase family protein [Flavobacteriales bacterium]
MITEADRFWPAVFHGWAGWLACFLVLYALLGAWAWAQRRHAHGWTLLFISFAAGAVIRACALEGVIALLVVMALLGMGYIAKPLKEPRLWIPAVPLACMLGTDHLLGAIVLGVLVFVVLLFVNGKRPAEQKRGPWWPHMLVAGVLVVSGVAGAIAFGPMRAARIAAAGVMTVLVDGLNEFPGAHRIPVIGVQVDPAALDSLNIDLPWSGKYAHKAEVERDGVHYPATYRYRGLVAGTHYLGGKKSFRLSFTDGTPFPPYRRINFINPKSNNFLNQHLAFWVGSYMGVAVPWSEPVFVTLNGRDHGVHHAIEQIDGEFEHNHGLADRTVPVYKGDYPPAVGREWPKPKLLWESTANWQYESEADSTAAHALLKRLVAVINGPGLSDSTRLDSLQRIIDVDAYVRFHAALKVLHCGHEDNRHNQWLVLSSRTGKFYPVLWDAVLLFSRTDEFYPIHDAIEFHLMKHAHLRLRRDQLILQALSGLVGDSLFDRRLSEEVEWIRPSALRDRNKYGEITDRPEDVLRFSTLHWSASVDDLRKDVHAYWRKLAVRMRIADLRAARKGDDLVARWSGDGTLGYILNGLGHEPVVPAYAAQHSMGNEARALKDGEHWIVPHELRIRLNGADPSLITFIDLVSGDTVPVGW